MALGRQGERQADLMLSWAELPRSPGHAFYDRLQAVLIEAGFDGFAEARCTPYYASKRGRPSLPPGRYFRMHLVGYFEGIDSTWSKTPGKLWKVGETADGGARENPVFPPFLRLAAASIRRCCTCVPGVFDQMPSTASAGWSGAAPTACPCASSCAWAAPSGCP